jgi:hypothetical protein
MLPAARSGSESGRFLVWQIFLQNTLFYIIIVCKQTSAYYYHKSSDLPYSKNTRVFFN